MDGRGRILRRHRETEERENEEERRSRRKNKMASSHKIGKSDGGEIATSL